MYCADGHIGPILAHEEILVFFLLSPIEQGKHRWHFRFSFIILYEQILLARDICHSAASNFVTDC
jgi:hypothetical protein